MEIVVISSPGAELFLCKRARWCGGGRGLRLPAAGGEKLVVVSLLVAPVPESPIGLGIGPGRGVAVATAAAVVVATVVQLIQRI
jgi:hypothetical protein